MRSIGSRLAAAQPATEAALRTVTPQRSYSSNRGGALRLLAELRDLVRHHRSNVSGRVGAELTRLEAAERAIADVLGIDLRGRRMLDLGAGQRLLQMAYFTARGNDVVGVDRDVVAQGFNPLEYVHIARANGALRATKTLVRKTLGIDAAYRRELERQLGSARLPRRLEVHQMDAGAMSFPDASFDFVYSFRVFQHLEEPARVAAEIARVVRPGGGAYLTFLPYTAANGCLDLRMLAGRADELPPWPHLRDDTRALVRESAYLNRLRLSDYAALFEESMPGSTLVVQQSDVASERELAERLRADGPLRNYGLDELLATDAAVFWRRSA